MHEYAPGEILNSPPAPGAPEGFLLKVISSTAAAGRTEVQTEPASIYEAVPEAEISTDLSNVAAAVPQNAAARRLSAAMEANSSATPSDTPTKVPFHKEVTCKASGHIAFTGGYSLSVTPHFTLKWHLAYSPLPHPSLDEASATDDGHFEAWVAGWTEGNANCSLPEVTLAEPKWTVFVDVGPVVLPVTVDIPITLSGSAETEGHVNVKAETVAQGSLGIKFEGGTVSAVHSFSAGASLHHEAAATGRFEAELGSELKISAGYHVPVFGQLAVELKTSATSMLELGFDSTSSPPGTYCLPLVIDGEALLDLPKDYSFTIGRLTLYDHPITCGSFGGAGGIETEEGEDGEIVTREEVKSEESGEERAVREWEEHEQEEEEATQEIEAWEAERELLVPPSPPGVPSWFVNELELVEDLQAVQVIVGPECRWSETETAAFGLECFGVLSEREGGPLCEEEEAYLEETLGNCGEFSLLACTGAVIEGDEGYVTYSCEERAGAGLGPAPASAFLEYLLESGVPVGGSLDLKCVRLQTSGNPDSGWVSFWEVWERSPPPVACEALGA